MNRIKGPDGEEYNQFILPVINSNMFILFADNTGIIIDPFFSLEADSLILEKQVTRMVVFLTHEHFDHISGVNHLRKLCSENGIAISVICSEICTNMIGNPKSNLSNYFRALLINKGEEEIKSAEELFDEDYVCSSDISFVGTYGISIGNFVFALRETPGHSPASICIEIYNANKELLSVATGDSLVQGSKVITRLPNGNKKEYNEITKPYLEAIPRNTLILPGHGSPATVLDIIKVNQ